MRNMITAIRRLRTTGCGTSRWQPSYWLLVLEPLIESLYNPNIIPSNPCITPLCGGGKDVPSFYAYSDGLSFVLLGAAKADTCTRKNLLLLIGSGLQALYDVSKDHCEELICLPLCGHSNAHSLSLATAQA